MGDLEEYFIDSLAIACLNRVAPGVRIILPARTFNIPPAANIINPTIAVIGNPNDLDLTNIIPPMANSMNPERQIILKTVLIFMGLAEENA